jgi:hypothetical protein
MKTWSFYNLETGDFTGQTFRGLESMLADNTPPGCGAIEGRHDRHTKMVNVATGQVVEVDALNASRGLSRSRAVNLRGGR